MVSKVYAYVQTHEIIYSEYVQFFIYQLELKNPDF